MIQPGTPDQIPALKAIWAASFPEDPPEAIEDFFARCFRPEECLTAFEGGEPVSMVFLLPALYQRGGKAFPVQYIYAAATLPAWRGRGIFGALLRGALEEGRRRGQFASFLHPGEPSLAAYYGRFGYRAGFRAAVDRLNREEMLTAGGSAAGIRLLAGCPDYAARRDRLLAGSGAYVKWEERLAGLAVSSAVSAGGGVLAGPDGLALCEPSGGVLAVRELLCPPQRRADYLCALAAQFDAPAYHIHRPAQAGETGETVGLIRPLHPEAEDWDAASYMGLTLE